MTTTNVPDTKANRRRAKVRVAPATIAQFTNELLGETLHEGRVDSIALGVTGVLHAGHLSIHAIGRGLAAARGTDAKHGTKQVDRLLSNTGVELWRLFESWVRFVVGDRQELVVALDASGFGEDAGNRTQSVILSSYGGAQRVGAQTSSSAHALV